MEPYNHHIRTWFSFVYMLYTCCQILQVTTLTLHWIESGTAACEVFDGLHSAQRAG